MFLFFARGTRRSFFDSFFFTNPSRIIFTPRFLITRLAFRSAFSSCPHPSRPQQKTRLTWTVLLRLYPHLEHSRDEFFAFTNTATLPFLRHLYRMLVRSLAKRLFVTALLRPLFAAAPLAALRPCHRISVWPPGPFRLTFRSSSATTSIPSITAILCEVWWQKLLLTFFS